MRRRMAVYSLLEEFYGDGNRLLHIGNHREAAEYLGTVGVSEEDLKDFILEHGACSHVHAEEVSAKMVEDIFNE